MSSLQNRKQYISMKKCLQLFLSLSVLAIAARAADYQQLPGHGGGLQSDGSLLVVADDFVLTDSIGISGFTWWGGYDNTPTGSDSFLIRLHADSAGQPGSLLPEFAVGSTSRTLTGAFVSSGTYPEYIYTTTLDTPFLAQAGVRYWLSIANPMTTGQTWQWELSGSSPNIGAQRFFGGAWHPHPVVGTAFAVPEPSSLVLFSGGLGIGWLFIRRRGKRKVQ